VPPDIPAGGGAYQADGAESIKPAGIPMNAPNDNTAPKGLRGWWASPPRSGMQRIIVPFEYRHLRFWAGVRIAVAIVVVGLGAVTLSFSGNHGVTYGWTAFCRRASEPALAAFWLRI
jgi:hypothetical protein